MGLCGSSDNDAAALRRRHRDIERRVKKHKRRDDEIIKVLLLGAGESGKSTIFKQMRLIYGNGFSKDEKDRMREPILREILESLCSLIIAAKTEKVEVDPGLDPAITWIKENRESLRKLNTDGCQHIKKVWNSATVQAMYQKRIKLQVPQNLAYFMDRIDAIAKGDKYLPSDEDYLHIRIRTTGVIQEQFEMDGLRLKLIDVGGQRSERSKWIHSFDGVKALIFVVALSEYDQLCFEDNTTNRMQEALSLFEGIVNQEHFRDKPVVVFMNKKDLFDAKYTANEAPIANFFPEYKGTSLQDAYDFFENMFHEKREFDTREIAFHFTTATDRESVVEIFKTVRRILITECLEGDGIF